MRDALSKRRSYRRSCRRRGRLEPLAKRMLLAGDLQSPYQPRDVNLDLQVSELDALAVIDLLRDQSTPELGAGFFPDVTGNGQITPHDVLLVINELIDDDPAIASRLIHDSGFAGSANYDLVTNAPGIEIWASEFLDEIELTIDGTSFDDLAGFEVDGRLVLSDDDIDGLVSGHLQDGDHQVAISIPGRNASIDFTLSIDRTVPTPVLDADDGRLRLRQRSVEFLFDEPLAPEAIAESNSAVEVTSGGNVIDSVPIEAITQDATHRLTLRFADKLNDGEYRITLSPRLCDLAGNEISSDPFPLLVHQTADLVMDPQSQFVTVSTADPTISVRWDVATQKGVVATSPGPTVASRAYAMVHTAMFDAWSAYNADAVSTVNQDVLQRPANENTDANKAQAMSHAAYRVLSDLFPEAQQIFDDLMVDLGYDRDNDSTDVTTPAGIGNVMAAELLQIRHADGSNQLGDSPDGVSGVKYSNVTEYAPLNPVGQTDVIGAWTPEYVPIDATAATAIREQSFLTPHWSDVTPFSLTTASQFRPEPPEPFLLVDGAVDLDTQTITLADQSVMTIDRSLIGTVINPDFIAQAQRVIDASGGLTDRQKLIAEFWEDAGSTSFPPGTWMSFGQFLSGRDEHSLDQDAGLFFALSNAVFDAGIATWEAKAFYDYARPVRVIRELGELGLIGQFHQASGTYRIDVWSPQTGTTQSIPATEFLTYQTPGSDPSPPFAEYTSGHSSFSAAGATILERFAGSPEFGGEVTFDTGESRFQPGAVPAAPVTLQWSTFREAADEAGLSRIYGGIHFDDGDLQGRKLGNDIGMAVWQRAQQYIDGTVGSS
ncbi:DUF6851 domain-containing protein [Rhodopirellula sp. JC639]|uniref:DUF6851 domain-containing protein n=1 Tax=Stieleria mannarensis TaxID=2755585 RepID=UPI0015FF0DC7|nr:dockerin type I domain-containing protein [Rhodopirellula sp. JC639]